MLFAYLYTGLSKQMPAVLPPRDFGLGSWESSKEECGEVD